MKDEIEDGCINEIDIFHHLLEEQIAYICVKEEEEQLRKEITNSDPKMQQKGY